MENLHIKATKYTPEVDFNARDGVLGITGKSYPENTFEYYKPVIAWVEEYLKKSEVDIIIFNLDLEYLNSSSLKVYFDLFDILEIAYGEGKKFEINWIYDEENDIAQETGEDFIEDFDNLEIKLVPKG